MVRVHLSHPRRSALRRRRAIMSAAPPVTLPTQAGSTVAGWYRLGRAISSCRQESSWRYLPLHSGDGLLESMIEACNCVKFDSVTQRSRPS